MSKNELDHIWKALSDPTRRKILDLLREGSRTTTEVVDHFPDFSRFAVMKHLDVLRRADMVITLEEGRKRINSLNTEPIRAIFESWLTEFAPLSNRRIIDFKQGPKEKPRRISKLKNKKDFGWTKYDHKKS